MRRDLLNKGIIFVIVIAISYCGCSAAENKIPSASSNSAVQKTSWFKNKGITIKKKKTKKARVEEVKLPPVIQGRPKIPFSQIPVKSIDDCVEYALSHSPLLKKQRKPV